MQVIAYVILFNAITTKPLISRVEYQASEPSLIANQTRPLPFQTFQVNAFR
jgi:hypothetical protein